MDKLPQIDTILAGLILLSMCFLLNAQIIGRQFGVSTPWVGELARIMNIWIVFLIVGRLSFQNGHIKIDYFYEKFGDAARGFLKIGILTICIATTLSICVSGVLVIFDTWGDTTQTAEIPIALIFAVAVVGVVIMTIVYAKQLIDTIIFGYRVIAGFKSGETK